MSFYDNKYNFLKYKNFFMGISLIFFTFSIIFFFTKGLNLGVDFKGGTVIEMKFEEMNKSEDIRKSLLKINLGDVKVKEFGSNKEFLATIEQKGKNNDFVSSIKNHLEKDLNKKVDFRRVEVVGSKISKELTRDGIYSVLLALILMLIYIWFRFEWQFSLGSILALVHDVIITIGAFSLIGYEFNLSIVAAILTIVGYSMNDTVIIYDRIREYIGLHKRADQNKVINAALNTTLSRTINTSLTTLLVLLIIFLFGGDGISGFSLALLIGVAVGTYSSIFIAAPSVVEFTKNLMPVSTPSTDK